MGGPDSFRPDCDGGLFVISFCKFYPFLSLLFQSYQFLIVPGEAIVMTQSGGATPVAQLLTHLYAYMPSKHSTWAGHVPEQPYRVPRDIASNIFHTD